MPLYSNTWQVMLSQCCFLYLNSLKPVATEMMANFRHLNIVNVELQNAKQQVDYCSNLVDICSKTTWDSSLSIFPTWNLFSRACHTIHCYDYFILNSLPSCPVQAALIVLQLFGFHNVLHCLKNSEVLISCFQLLCFLINRTWKEGVRYNHCS